MVIAGPRAAAVCGLALCLAGLGLASGYPSGTLLVTEGGNNINNATLLVVRQAGNRWLHPCWHMLHAASLLPTTVKRSCSPSASTRRLIRCDAPAQAYTPEGGTLDSVNLSAAVSGLYTAAPVTPRGPPAVLAHCRSHHTDDWQSLACISQS